MSASRASVSELYIDTDMADPSLDAFIAVTIEQLRAHLQQPSPGRKPKSWSCASVAHAFARREIGGAGYEVDSRKWELLPLALEAAWELVRRGLLRPGASAFPNMGSDGSEFAITQAGAEWLRVAENDEVLLLQPGSAVRVLSEYTFLYGKGYQQRALEALKARQARAYLASCAMCGAAAESILLALAIAREDDEEAVLKSYNSRSGRSQIVRLLTGQVVEPLRLRFNTNVDILSYWRDEAAHGVASTLTDAHAEAALTHLLRLAQLASSHWSEFTGKPVPANP